MSSPVDEGRFEVTERGVFDRAIDRETGARVLIRPRGNSAAWPRDVDAEACARTLLREPMARVRPVVAVGDGVVFEDAPGPQREGPMPLRDAAECALQACEVAATFASRGYHQLSFDEYGLDAGYLDGRPAARFTVPPAEQRRRPPFRERFWPRSVWHDAKHPEAGRVAMVCCLLFELAPSAYVRPRGDARATGDGAEGLRARFERRRLSRADDAPRPENSIEQLSRYCYESSGDRPDGVDTRVVYRFDAVARLLADVIATPDAHARAEALARLTPKRLDYDWDAIAAEGESMLARADAWRAPYLTLPLAEAHHQRASAAWARGDFESALTAVNRAIALDRVMPYLVTRSVVLAALGRVGEARFAIDAAFDASEGRGRDADDGRRPTRYDPVPVYEPDDAERARAHAARGAVALRERRPQAALADLEKAVRLAPANARYTAALASCRARLSRE